MPIASLLLGTLMLQAGSSPASRPFVGPPSPYRLGGQAEVWVLDSYLPDMKKIHARSGAGLLGSLQGGLTAREIRPKRIAVEPLQFLPPLRYGGQPLPKVYTLGKGVEW